MLVDVHCHLDHIAFKEDLDQVISRARAAGVSAIITNGINPATNRATLAIAAKYPTIVKAALGIYPIEALAEEVKNLNTGWKIEPFDVGNEIRFIEEQAVNKSISAIGEIGLDDYSVKGTLEGQIPVFEKLVELAKRTGLPVIVHNRRAEDRAVEILEKSGINKAVLHCFTGSLKTAKKAVSAGHNFSIPASVVRSEQFQQLVKILPISCILTETDAPYLGIEKGKRSEPSDVAGSIKKIAELKRVSEEEMKNIVYMNYTRVFG